MKHTPRTAFARQPDLPHRRASTAAWFRFTRITQRVISPSGKHDDDDDRNGTHDANALRLVPVQKYQA